MRKTALLLGTMLLLTVLLAGCSGSGVKVARLTDTSLHALAADHLSAVQLFYGWLGVLYQRAPEGVQPSFEYEMLPDGTMHAWGDLTDGGHYEFWVADGGAGAGHGTVTWPPDGSGRPQQYSWQSDAVVYSEDGLTATNHVVSTYPNGATIDTVVIDDFSDPGGLYHGSWDGTARLPGGATMHFTLDRKQNDRDQLRLELPDGSVMTLRIPIIDPIPQTNWPRFAEGATGTFAAPGRGASQLQIAAQSQPDGDGQWNRWQFTAADGTAGDFALETNSAGTGQLLQGGNPVGALRWTADALGTLDLLGAGVQEVTPSAAARDFRIDKWLRNTACLGPAPVY